MRRASALSVVLLLAVSPAWGADEAARSAEDLLRRTEAEYTGLISFHFAAEEVTETRSGDSQRRISANYVTALDAKGRSRVEIRDQSKKGLAVFDGEYNWVYLPRVNQYTRTRSVRKTASGVASSPPILVCSRSPLRLPATFAEERSTWA